MDVVILRGVPGSGKSTLARHLVAKNGAGIIHSTDSYFFVGGMYVFRKELLPHYHSRNITAFRNSLATRKPLVICDNTNVKRWHFKPYEDLARQHGYTVAVISLPHPDPAEAAKRNTHGVPEDEIRRMIEEWEE